MEQSQQLQRIVCIPLHPFLSVKIIEIRKNMLHGGSSLLHKIYIDFQNNSHNNIITASLKEITVENSPNQHMVNKEIFLIDLECIFFPIIRYANFFIFYNNIISI